MVHMGMGINHIEDIEVMFLYKGKIRVYVVRGVDNRAYPLVFAGNNVRKTPIKLNCRNIIPLPPQRI